MNNLKKSYCSLEKLFVEVADIIVRVIGVAAIIFLAWWVLEPTVSSVITAPTTTQPAIETVITQIRGCDIIQLVKSDEMISAFPAPDQPDSCKVVTPETAKTSRRR